MESWRWIWCHDPTEPSRPSMRCRPSYPRFDASENPQSTRGATDPIMGAKVRHNRDNRRQPEAFYRPGIFLQIAWINTAIRDVRVRLAPKTTFERARYPCPGAREHGEAESQNGR